MSAARHRSTAVHRTRRWWGRLDSKQRWPIALGTPLLAVIVLVGIAVAATSAGPVARSARSVATSTTAAAGRSAAALRALPHDRAATAGAIPFSAKPPRRGAKVPPGSAGVPAVAVAAYQHAALVMYFRNTGCHLTWEDVAGIGRVESDNGQTWGGAARVTSNGTLFPPILGPVLDGTDGFPAIPTTDGGKLEHDALWTRAVGPMQFLPSTWFAYAQDGNGDGVKDPQNFYDAALTTGDYLCVNGGNLATPGGLHAAILAYNHSDSYVSLVLSWIAFYGRVGAAGVSAAGRACSRSARPARRAAAGRRRPPPRRRRARRPRPSSRRRPPRRTRGGRSASASTRPRRAAPRSPPARARSTSPAERRP